MNGKDVENMIRHIVMFKLKKEADNKCKAELLETAQSLLQNFKEEIPALKKFECVMNSDEAPDSNCDIALICDFDNIEGLDEYQKHPKHLKFAEFIVKVRESRACIDYEV